MPRNNIKSAQLTTFAANTLGVSGAYTNVQICILFLFLTLYIGPMSVPKRVHVCTELQTGNICQ